MFSAVFCLAGCSLLQLHLEILMFRKSHVSNTVDLPQHDVWGCVFYLLVLRASKALLAAHNKQ